MGIGAGLVTRSIPTGIGAVPIPVPGSIPSTGTGTYSTAVVLGIQECLQLCMTVARGRPLDRKFVTRAAGRTNDRLTRDSRVGQYIIRIIQNTINNTYYK